MDIYEILEDYLEQLDETPVNPDKFFKKWDDKERYESVLMYAVKKYQAAQYHFENVKKFLEKEKVNVEKIRTMDIKEININSLKKGDINIKFEFLQTKQFEADHYVYELSAFLEALKSSIDFLSTVIGIHLRGIQLDSIRTLIKLVKKGRLEPLLDQIRSNLIWLEYIQSYRHHVVHRLIFSMEGGYTFYNVDGFSGVTDYPIVIPRAPPTYIPDTRESRAGENDHISQPGLSKMKKEGYIKIGNEKEIRTHFELKYTPVPGYIPIEEFMKSQLDSYEAFFLQIINELTKLNFTTIFV